MLVLKSWFYSIPRIDNCFPDASGLTEREVRRWLRVVRNLATPHNYWHQGVVPLYIWFTGCDFSRRLTILHWWDSNGQEARMPSVLGSSKSWHFFKALESYPHSRGQSSLQYARVAYLALLSADISNLSVKGSALPSICSPFPAKIRPWNSQRIPRWKRRLALEIALSTLDIPIDVTSTLRTSQAPASNLVHHDFRQEQPSKGNWLCLHKIMQMTPKRFYAVKWALVLTIALFRSRMQSSWLSSLADQASVCIKRTSLLQQRENKLSNSAWSVLSSISRHKIQIYIPFKPSHHLYLKRDVTKPQTWKWPSSLLAPLAKHPAASSLSLTKLKSATSRRHAPLRLATLIGSTLPPSPTPSTSPKTSTLCILSRRTPLIRLLAWPLLLILPSRKAWKGLYCWAQVQ